MKRIFKLTIIFIIMLAVRPAAAFELKPEFPKLANYYLQPNVPASDFDNLSKYDLVIMDVDAESVGPSLITRLRGNNPAIKTFAYIPSQSVNIQDLGAWADFRREAYAEAEAGDRWLKDSSGNYVYFSNTWPTIRFVDIGNGWSDYLSGQAAERVNNGGWWDGVFYDMVFANLSWLNNGNIDLDKNGVPDDISTVNEYWLRNSNSLIDKTRSKIAGRPVAANVDIVDKFAGTVDGVMLENFPADWLGAGGWAKLETSYIDQTVKATAGQKIYIINANTDNSKIMASYRQMRYGLASTLLGDGYFSFDSGDQDHAQTWWYDEYEVKLGKATGQASNLLDAGSSVMKAGLWRRDFERGVAIVNSTATVQKYVFKNEEFEKIDGRQDRLVNDGSRVNWIKLEPYDGVILEKTAKEIVDQTFDNGGFVRVYDQTGEQTRNGFFSYIDNQPGNTQISKTDIDADLVPEIITSENGSIKVSQGGKIKTVIAPFGAGFKKTVNFAAADLNGDGTKEIIVAPGAGGGPQVRIFSTSGKLLSAGFFAYDKKFRGGVSLAVADLSGDALKEIIVAPGAGGGPQVRIFSTSGKLLSAGFFAYDKKFRGGISLAAADVNGDKKNEIITAAASGGERVRIFDSQGKMLSQFSAYGEAIAGGVKVSTSDLNRDGRFEILVSSINL